MNMRIEYLYRDASNYKQRHDVVLGGLIAETVVRVCLCEGEYFLPSFVGLPTLQQKFRQQGFVVPTEDDHPWHEIESMRTTSAGTTVDVSAACFVRLLRKCRALGWEECARISGLELHGPTTLDT